MSFMNYLKSFTDQLVTNFVALFILSQLFKHEHFCRKYALISRTKSISYKNRKKLNDQNKSYLHYRCQFRLFRLKEAKPAKRPKRNETSEKSKAKRNKRNQRNDQNETIKTKQTLGHNEMTETIKGTYEK